MCSREENTGFSRMGKSQERNRETTMRDACFRGMIIDMWIYFLGTKPFGFSNLLAHINCTTNAGKLVKIIVRAKTEMAGL